MPNNLLFGTGFESFWLGPRVEQLWQKYWWHPNQAHNGYIETYINLGAVGVTLLLLMIASGFFCSPATPCENEDPFGPVRFALIVTIIIFNYTDANLQGAAHPLLHVPSDVRERRAACSTKRALEGKRLERAMHAA
jgi:hypothetical protein